MAQQLSLALRVTFTTLIFLAAISNANAQPVIVHVHEPVILNSSDGNPSVIVMKVTNLDSDHEVELEAGDQVWRGTCQLDGESFFTVPVTWYEEDEEHEGMFIEHANDPHYVFNLELDEGEPSEAGPETIDLTVTVSNESGSTGEDQQAVSVGMKYLLRASNASAASASSK